MLSPYATELREKLQVFVEEHCHPAEIEYEAHMEKLAGKDRWSMSAIPPCIERLKETARKWGLWNLFLPHSLPKFILADVNYNYSLAPREILSNREYGILCEIMGRSFLCPEACNCNAPDTGNMEVLLKHGTEQQQKDFLIPLLKGEIRSTFLMTEPDVASSDATNMQTSLTKMLDSTRNDVSYMLNGKKWWSTGAMDPRCQVAIVLTRMDYSHPSCQSTQESTGATATAIATATATTTTNNDNTKKKHGAHTMVLVPMNTPGMKCIRPLTVFGYDDAPHGHAEVHLTNVLLNSSNLILGEGKGFHIAQSRLGPGRIHHCMRAVGLAARCYELMLERSLTRETFGKALFRHGGCQEEIADSKIDLESARLLTLNCALLMDEQGPAKARDQIALIKVAVPQLTLRVVDRAVQVFGGAGVSGDFPLARALAGLRTLRIADGPDAVHKRTLALMEVKKAISKL